MAGTVMPAPKFIGLDNNANPVSGGKLYTYVAGTTTPQATYSDVNLTVANANPVVLDSAGRATVFLSGSSYKFVLKDSDDVTIWTQDNVQAVAPFSTNLDIQGVAGEAILAGQACYLSDGSGALIAGRWYLADADNAYASSLPQIAMAPDAIDAGETGTFRLQGVVTKSNAQADFVVGDTYYVSATAGLLSLSPGTNVRVMGQADSTTTIVISPNPPNIATTPTFIDGITVTSTDAGAAAAPYLDLYRESASPAASDQIGEVRLSGEDSAGNKQLYARIYGQIADPTSTSEDGQVRVSVVSNGTETLMLVLTESGAFLPDLTTQDLGSGAKPWRNVFLSGTGKLDFGNGDVTVTASANTLTWAGASSGYIFNDGNIGVGVTPKTFTSGKAVEIGAAGNIAWGNGGGDMFVASNLYYNADFKYAATNAIAAMRLQDGVVKFLTAPSGTADTTATMTERFRVLNGGNVAIGATARLYLDGVAGTGDSYITEVVANNIRIVAGGNNIASFGVAGGSGSEFFGQIAATYPTTASAANVYVAGDGNAISRSTSSLRYKHDISTLDTHDALSAVMAMRPVTYRGKTDEDQRRFVGFIAEEMQEIAPLLCTYDDGGESGTPNYVTYDRVTAYLVAVVQQQQQKIAALEARIH